MTIRPSNWAELSKRGARMDNADYVALKCKKCGLFAFYDEERMQLFLNSQDLTSASLYGFEGAEIVTCTACGSADSFVAADAIDVDELEKGPWAFAAPFAVCD